MSRLANLFGSKIPPFMSRINWLIGSSRLITVFNERQITVIQRMIREGRKGFEG